MSQSRFILKPMVTMLTLALVLHTQSSFADAFTRPDLNGVADQQWINKDKLAWVRAMDWSDIGYDPTKPPPRPSTPQKPIPVLSANPAQADSSEKADVVPLSQNQYAGNNKQVNLLNLKDARDQGLDGSEVKVGVVDQPVNVQHPAFANPIHDLGQFGIQNPPASIHGTVVALNIAGKNVNDRVMGIAPNVNLYMAAASDRNADTMNMGAALDALEAMNRQGVKIVNNSYGVAGTSNFASTANSYINLSTDEGKKSTQIGRLNALVQDDMLLIFSTGNKGKNQPNQVPLFPLIEPELQKGIIAVAGVGQNNVIAANSNRCGDAKNWCMVAYWRMDTANQNAQAGDDIDTMPVSTNAGTSISAPQVTAAAALIKQKYPWMGNDNLRTTLLTTATDLGAKGVDAVYGWGLLNVGKAVNGPAQFAFGDFSANVTQGSYVFSNDIDGAGGLIKKGEGTLVLKGHHTYQGKTEVNAGRLVVEGSNLSSTHIASQAIYQLTGTTGAVDNQGTFISNDATINGDFSQNAEATFQTSLGSMTTVHGVANLAGQVYFDGRKAGFIPEEGTDIPVIMAQQRHGEFADSQLSTDLLLEGRPSYDDKNVYFHVSRITARQAVQDHQILTGGVADSAIISAARALDNTFQQLDTVSTQNIQKPQWQDMLLGAADIQHVQSVASLKRSLYSLSGTVYSNANVVNTLTLDKLNHDFMTVMRNDSEQVAAILQLNHRNNHWNPAGMSGKQNTNSGILGASKNFGQGLSGAIAYTFQQGHWAEQDSRAKIKSNGLMLGSVYAPEDWYGFNLSGSVAYHHFSHDVHRQLWLGENSENTGVKAKGDVWQLALNGGKAFYLDKLTFFPQLGIRYDYLRQDGFDEPGAHGFGLHARKLNKGVMTGLAGLTGAYHFDVNSTLVTVSAAVGLEHDFQDRDYATHGGFLGMKNNTRAGHWSASKNRWYTSLGGNLQITPKISAGVGYQYEQGSHWHSNAGNINVKVRF
ncbi:S8 family serine peptidase [Neisseriaceae bacterium ESL0693]|nr:S8 family serine peptidase [Neisseriaceae bacterium ESL0693]